MIFISLLNMNMISISFSYSFEKPESFKSMSVVSTVLSVFYVCRLWVVASIR